MKNRPLAAMIALIIAYCLTTGCAARPATIAEATDPAILNPPPMTLAAAEDDTQNTELSDEDNLLLEDGFGWGDEDEQDFYTVADPLEKWNRAMFVLNDKLYFWLMKPVAKGYRAVLPQPARSGVKNFFFNASAPVRIINNILQGKGRAAEAEVARFLYNSTVGVLGFGDPARNHPELNPNVEDLGQSLATYGFIDGFYIMWPVVGPSTLRDTAGIVGDRFLNPFAYVDPIEASLAISTYDVVNDLSFRIGDYESIKKAALDPYEAVRNGYIQQRQINIKK